MKELIDKYLRKYIKPRDGYYLLATDSLQCFNADIEEVFALEDFSICEWLLENPHENLYISMDVLVYKIIYLEDKKMIFQYTEGDIKYLYNTKTKSFDVTYRKER